MKAEILKIAGVKSEKEFYKKYPSEEAFMKVHGKAFKKAQTGAAIDKAQNGYPMPFDSSLEGSPGFQQQGYNNVGASTANTFAPGNYNSWDIDNNGVPDTIQQSKGNPLNNNSVAEKTPGGGMAGAMPYIQSGMDVIQGISAIKGQRNRKKEAKQNVAVTDVLAKASESVDVDLKRQQSESIAKQREAQMPVNTGEEFFPIYGVGTNVLARNGVRLQEGGEIQNTYAPNNLYDDLGYEPLNDSNIKQYYHGGRIHQMVDGGGMSPDMYGQIGNTATNLSNQYINQGGQPDAGSMIGGGIGGAVGTAFGGPIGGAIGKFAGSTIGGLIDTTDRDIKKLQDQSKANVNRITGQAFRKGIQGQFSSYVRDGGDIPNYEDGGYMNPEYNPQLITMFGDHNAQDFADYAHKFRAGGHLKSYTPPSERAMETYEDGGGIKSYGLGGELETHWGGGAETMSYNPYLPGTGETVMFRGKSHEEYSPNGETGIGVTYGGNPVEVERGEPMVELEEGGQVDPQTGEPSKSGVVFGNLKIPNQYIDLLGDKSAKGMKFKNYVANLSKTEAKQNKLIEKTTNDLNDFIPLTSFDKLKMSALQANIQGANMKLKSIADKKINAASLQNAINDTAEENGLVADDLARGKIKVDKEAMKQYAKYGGSFPKAQEGKKLTKEEYNYLIDLYSQAEKQKKGPIVEKFQREFSRLVPEKAKSVLSKFPVTNYGKSKGIKKDDVASNYDQIFGYRTKAYRASLTEPEADIVPITPTTTPTVTTGETTTAAPSTTTTQETTKGKFNWMNIVNGVLPYLRPTDQEELDISQIYPEMYAMASNQLEPVPAQGYRPDLNVPYDISFQDQLNANQSDYRAAQRIAGYNPAAQASLNAQKYQANQQVLGNQFRANQEMKDRVYSQNRNTLNDAKLKNLDIFDRQYGRQAEAKSNTKATTQAALNSISDKYAKNKLENRTLGVYENMYNYRFGKSGRAQNWNGLQFFDTEAGGGKGGDDAPEGYEPTSYDKYGNVNSYRRIKDKDLKDEMDELEAVGKTPGIGDGRKNGGPIKKNYKNSSVVRAYKNL